MYAGYIGLQSACSSSILWSTKCEWIPKMSRQYYQHLSRRRMMESSMWHLASRATAVDHQGCHLVIHLPAVHLSLQVSGWTLFCNEPSLSILVLTPLIQPIEIQWSSSENKMISRTIRLIFIYIIFAIVTAQQYQASFTFTQN